MGKNYKIKFRNCLNSYVLLAVGCSGSVERCLPSASSQNESSSTLVHSPASPTDSFKPYEAYIHASTLRLRAACNDEATRIGSLQAGQKVRVLEEQNGWLRVQVTDSSTTGCIKRVADYIQIDPPDATKYQNLAIQATYRRDVSSEQLTEAHNWAKRAYALNKASELEALVLFSWIRRYQALIYEGKIGHDNKFTTEVVKLQKDGLRDNLWSLCDKYYQDPYLWVALWKYNQTRIGDNPNILRPGTRIVFPSIAKLLGELSSIYADKLGAIKELKIDDETQVESQLTTLTTDSKPAMITVNTKEGDTIGDYVRKMTARGPEDPGFRTIEGFIDGFNYIVGRAHGVPSLQTQNFPLSIPNLSALGLEDLPEESDDRHVEAELLLVGQGP